ncbi:NAD(P)(+) transhydrogenase (Re/Si-specific) subunit beta [Flavilitoribacter nigricans]|uniref:NAD(P) transhydrogenase subunit beta n=1 Tax=Flavilitoribacter nigricans (strain ATCC 23147 / DSM 23189 / NBRC 102662 / NCIMB 1420 / SS-2) TaxID=1122177 RepID=A0A2D0N2V8_FLAN2|nr:NAD(P)(+) transhydrogenase (Re/Si-specific) subunit beta [Flavilitoribacter nigricans]PHN02835.1 NAD(P) transhydrogenase subunit beta [Flavilitoribacter nigricans DSM 23189 = NBRC 102662]
MAVTFYINLAYLLGAIAFVWGLRLLSTPDTARRGNILASIGMGLAIIAAMLAPLENTSNNYGWILGGMAVGAGIGWVSARRIQMTAMPQMVSMFNGLGGACAVVLALVEVFQFYGGERTLDSGQLVIVLSTLLIGGVAFTGSLLAFGKLQGLVRDNTLTLPKHNIINQIMLLVLIVMGVMLVIQGQEAGLTMAMIFTVLALIYGFSFVIPIGGADMPVVISLLNSFTGLSAAAAGLIYENNFMLVGGILVGASGTILTVLMCEAMNRSLLNVLIGGFGGGGGSAKGADGDQVAKEVSINDAAIQLYYSNSVMFVPGYGLAVAQAQKVCKEVDDLLEANGVDVKYAIHPVAGRMPGHMNVLLAEADVPYPKLLDLDDANSALPNTDMVVIVGANDVVNPAAYDDPGSPIYGMPVLNVWEAKNVIVLKRSMSTGYAGIQNPLFFHAKNRMLFGDAKDSLNKLVQELKNL